MRFGSRSAYKTGTVVDGKPCIWLQYFGWAAAKPASEFKVGENMLCNNGYRQAIVEISPKGATQINWTVRCESGKDWPMTVKRDRLVAYA